MYDNYHFGPDHGYLLVYTYLGFKCGAGVINSKVRTDIWNEERAFHHIDAREL
jgi:hypothetical protein